MVSDEIYPFKTMDRGIDQGYGQVSYNLRPEPWPYGLSLNAVRVILQMSILNVPCSNLCFTASTDNRMSGAPGVAEPGVRMTDRVDSRSLSTSTLDYGIGHLDKQQVKIESPARKLLWKRNCRTVMIRRNQFILKDLSLVFPVGFNSKNFPHPDAPSFDWGTPMPLIGPHEPTCCNRSNFSQVARESSEEEPCAWNQSWGGSVPASRGWQRGLWRFTW